MPPTVVISDEKTVALDAERDVLEDAGVAVEAATARTPAETAAAVADADGLIVDTGTPVTRDVIETADLSVVGRAGVGVDNVDLAAAADAGVTVVNVPDYGVNEVSTHALALLLACARQVVTYDRDVRDGGWDWNVGSPVHRLAGRTLGVVGLGRIGARLAEKAEALGLDVVAFDPYLSDEEIAARGADAVDFEELLARADVVSIHAPLTDETRGLFDAAAFDRLGDGAILVNTARGPIVDEDALVAALDDGALRAAGLDVTPREPPGDSPLVGREDVVLTPHAAWYSEESRDELGRRVAADVVRVLRGEDPESPVDPESGWA